MQQPFTTWFHRHPLTTLLLVATVCVNLATGAFQLQLGWIGKAVMVGLALGQIGLLALWSATFGRNALIGLSLTAAAIALFIIPTLAGEIRAWEYAPLIAFVALIVGAKFALLPYKTWRFSIKHVLIVTTVIAVLMGTIKMLGEHDLGLAFNTGTFQVFGTAALLAIAADFIFSHTSGVASHFLVMLVSIALAIAFGGSFDPHHRLALTILGYATQGLVYCTWLGVIRHEKRQCDGISANPANPIHHS